MTRPRWSWPGKKATSGRGDADNRWASRPLAAFLLRAEQDLSFREIAEVLEITEETARWRVYKARQKLVEVLAPQLDREKP